MQGNNSYKQILKAVSLFGGVQLINIFVNLLKLKIVALFIGTVGVGIVAILSNTLSFFGILTRCGLDITTVKEISSAKNEEVPKKISLTRQLALLTGITGFVALLFLSPLLSLIAFNNTSYTLFFVTISVVLIFSQLDVNNLAILQGVKSLNRLAKAIAISSVLSLFPTIILYYFLGQNGIPYVILITAILSFLVLNHFVKKLKIKKNKIIPLKQLFKEGKNILKTGLYLSLANIVEISVGLIIQLFILNLGGIHLAGLYNAGIILINSYVSIFFSVLSKDFFPRLVQVSKDDKLVNKIVNDQAYILILLLTPLIIGFIIFKSCIVTMFFSNEFLPILGMISYGILATVFKAVSWSMGYILIAKGSSKLYLISEVVSNLALLISIFVGYKINGLTGVGIGFLIYHILDLVFIKSIVTKYYNFYFDSNIISLLSVTIFLFVTMIYLYNIENEFIRFIFMILVVSFSLIFTIFKLNSHFKLIEVLKRKFKK